MSPFITWNSSCQPSATSMFLNSVHLPFLMKVESDVIKDVSSANMPEVLIERTFFAFSPFMYLLEKS